MRILISGAGVAGLSTAINLGVDGHDVTIVERADHLGAARRRSTFVGTRST